MTGFELNASVGVGGENHPDDVRALTERLVDLGYDWVVVGDEPMPPLRDVINLLQSIRAGRNRVRGDGRVDVPGPTYDWVRADNAPRWQRMPQGTSADGFFNFELTDEDDDHEFGTDWMVETIRTAGIRYRDAFLSEHPEGALIMVNDVSRPRGGNTPDHAGHETGLACDLRLPRTNGTAPGGTTHEHPAYDREAMRAMLGAIRLQPRTSRILFNDPVLIGEQLCRHARGHDDHVHFEIEPLFPVDDVESVERRLERAVRTFGGTVVDPGTYSMTRAGFQSYLDDTGVAHFAAAEMLRPNNESAAVELGYETFLPPHGWWPRGAALACIADELRSLVGEPVVMRNWWRPRPYNDAIANAPESDHVIALGVDLDYRSADSRRAAEHRLDELTDEEPWLEWSIGLGGRTTHVGVLTPRGRRTWTYDSYHP